MSQFSVMVFTVCCILMQVSSIHIVTGESSEKYNNVISYRFQQKSGIESCDNCNITKTKRFERSPPDESPQQLKIRVKFPIGEELDLIWIKKHKYLANQHLPVVLTSASSNSKVMETFGEFDIYHDMEKCSAVVHFRKDNVVYGIVGLDSTISALPYEFDIHGNYPTIVEAPYFSKRTNIPVHNDPILSILNDHLTTAEWSSCWEAIGQVRSPASDPEPSGNHYLIERDVDDVNDGEDIEGNMARFRRENPKVDNFFLEILVFVTSDVAQFFESLHGENYLEWVVRYFIIYFNTVDMIFKQQRAVELELHMNIAKIVVEDPSRPFNFINRDAVQFSETVEKLREYLRRNRQTYAPDSFDHVFISTNRPIMDGSVQVDGTKDVGMDFYEARETKQFHRGIPITVVGFLRDYIHVVHEISRTLKIESDPWTEGLESTGQCNSIMQDGSSKCDKCLKWNAHSKEQFNTFLRTDLNRCPLLNEPRSLRPPGTSRFISPLRQCQCFGYDFHVWKSGEASKSYIVDNECNLPLVCGKKHRGGQTYGYTLPPFDGTNCGGHKVCWDEVCTRLDNYCPMRLKYKRIGKITKTRRTQ